MRGLVAETDDPTMQPAARYLLGELPDAEEAAFDERLLGGDPVAEELAMAEEDLHEAYARGELAPERRRRFEERVLAQRGARARLALTRELVERATRAAPRVAPPPRAWRRPIVQAGFALAAAAVLALVLTAPWKRPAPPVETVVVELDPALRGGDVARVKLDGRAAAIELRAVVDDRAGRARYVWTLRKGGALVVGPIETATPSLRLGAESLAAGLYVVQIASPGVGGAAEEIGRFELAVDRP